MGLALIITSMTNLMYVLVVVSMLILPGCLLPPPLEEEVEITNQAPRIVVESLIPHPASGPILMNANCSSYSFRASITDPDIGDVLHWRVFLDYHRDTDRLDSNVSKVEVDPNSLSSGQPILFTVDPSDEKFFYDVNTDGVHTVELLVSDRPFYQEAVFPEGRSLTTDDALIDSFVWPVFIESSEPCSEEVDP